MRASWVYPVCISDFVFLILTVHFEWHSRAAAVLKHFSRLREEKNQPREVTDFTQNVEKPAK